MVFVTSGSPTKRSHLDILSEILNDVRSLELEPSSLTDGTSSDLDVLNLQVGYIKMYIPPCTLIQLMYTEQYLAYFAAAPIPTQLLGKGQSLFHLQTRILLLFRWNPFQTATNTTVRFRFPRIEVLFIRSLFDSDTISFEMKVAGYYYYYLSSLELRTVLIHYQIIDLIQFSLW